MYVDPDFKTKKELKKAVQAGELVTVFSPGPFPAEREGIVSIEGPHYPRPHSWYARVQVHEGRVTKVIG